jgi:prevent-host-death family protein
MDFEELKNLIQQEGGKIIVVENGKPVMVVLSFEDFKARNDKKEPQDNEEELTIDDLPL